MFIRICCCRGSEDTCTATAVYLDGSIMLLEGWLSCESRRLGGGGNEIEASLS